MKCQLEQILCNIATEVHKPYLASENGKPTLYLTVLKSLYGLLHSALLFYRKLRGKFEKIWFVVNRYSRCVANMQVLGKPLTVTCHIDDLKKK
jgi:hypothetical protein